MKLMNRKIASSLAAGAVAIATALAVASPANAATIDVNFEGEGTLFDSILFTVVQADQEFFCPTFDMAGDFDDVTNTGELDEVTAEGCTNDIFGHTTITPNDKWDFATGSNVGGTAWNAEIVNVTATLLSAGCRMTLAGEFDGTFDTSTQTLTPTSSDVIIADNPSGFFCAFLGFAQGQDIEIDGTWTNTGTPITLP